MKWLILVKADDTWRLSGWRSNRDEAFTLFYAKRQEYPDAEWRLTSVDEPLFEAMMNRGGFATTVSPLYRDRLSALFGLQR